ncbi:MAG: cache domain-containing protein [Deltaproteobacteria bacterium]|nr:cache domain-containing protein [Deltaproteobacteria bacterium]
MRIKVLDNSETQDLNSALALVSAMSVFERNRVVGVVYGGIILNKNSEFVDRIRDTILRTDKRKPTPLGTVTVFLDDIRVSTNVETSSGERAVGTRVSPEVRKQVLEEGKM